MLRAKLTALPAAVLLLASLGSVARAKPIVALKLSAMLVEHQANGAERLVPVEKTALRPGDVIRYIIVASNTGSNAAKDLVPAGRVPAGTVYVVGSASSPTATAEFSLDGGKTWSAVPTVKIRTQAGDVVKRAVPSAYTAVRWVGAKALAPNAADAFAYEVTVK